MCKFEDAEAGKARVVKALGERHPSVSAVGISRGPDGWQVALRVRRADEAAVQVARDAARPVVVDVVNVGEVFKVARAGS